MNRIDFWAVEPNGETHGSYTSNAVGYRNKDTLARLLVAPAGSYYGTSIICMFFRLDGAAALGSATPWVSANSATCYGSRLNSGTYMTQVSFSGTYTATANVTCKAVILSDYVSLPGGGDIGSFARYWSTNVNYGVGSGGNLFINWTINL